MASHLDTEELERQYRTLYWDRNELQIIATPEALKVAEELKADMESIVKQLGYEPAA